MEVLVAAIKHWFSAVTAFWSSLIAGVSVLVFEFLAHTFNVPHVHGLDDARVFLAVAWIVAYVGARIRARFV